MKKKTKKLIKQIIPFAQGVILMGILLLFFEIRSWVLGVGFVVGLILLVLIEEKYIYPKYLN